MHTLKYTHTLSHIHALAVGGNRSLVSEYGDSRLFPPPGATMVSFTDEWRDSSSTAGSRQRDRPKRDGCSASRAAASRQPSSGSTGRGQGEAAPQGRGFSDLVGLLDSSAESSVSLGSFQGDNSTSNLLSCDSILNHHSFARIVDDASSSAAASDSEGGAQRGGAGLNGDVGKIGGKKKKKAKQQVFTTQMTRRDKKASGEDSGDDGVASSSFARPTGFFKKYYPLVHFIDSYLLPHPTPFTRTHAQTNSLVNSSQKNAKVIHPT